MRLIVDCMPLRSGGGVQCALALIEGLQEQRSIVWRAVVPDVMVPAAPHLFTPEAVEAGRIVILPKGTPFDLLHAGRALARIERDFGANAVFTVFGPAYFRAHAPHLVGFALGNLIATAPGTRAGLRSRLLDAIRRFLVRRADHIVVETRTVRKNLSTQLGIAPGKISVIGNAVNPVLDRFPAMPCQNDTGFGIVIPSSYYPHKNLEIVSHVAVSLRRLAPDLPFEFRLTLDSESEPWKRLQATADTLGVADRLVALGSLSMENLADAYRGAAFVFLPTLCESSTAVYPEAFHFRRPLITSDLGFAHELCGSAAAFVPPHEAENIARTIIDLASNPEKADRLIAAGVAQLAAAYPSSTRKLEMQLDLLERLATGAAPPPIV